MKVSVLVLVIALLATLGGWMATLHTWADALTPTTLSGLLLNIVAVLGAAAGVNADAMKKMVGLSSDPPAPGQPAPPPAPASAGISVVKSALTKNPEDYR